VSAFFGSRYWGRTASRDTAGRWLEDGPKV